MLNVQVKDLPRPTRSLLVAQHLGKMKRMKNINSLRCKLFRKVKNRQSAGFCVEKAVYCSPSRNIIWKLIRESKPFLSKEAHTLFSNELKSSFRNKFNRRYDDDMKELCLLWYYASPKGYRTISKALNLPTTRTLRNWQAQLKVDPGINHAIVESIRKHFSGCDEESPKIASLVFDEISINEELHYDVSRDRIIGVVDTGKILTNDKAKSALVCMVRGTTSKWKHIRGYWFLGGTSTSKLPIWQNMTLNIKEEI
jgi:hypothetical protein